MVLEVDVKKFSKVLTYLRKVEILVNRLSNMRSSWGGKLNFKYTFQLSL